MLLLSTNTLKGYGIHRIFEFAKQTGFTGLDLTLSINNYDLWDGDYISELSEKFDLPVLSITAPQRGMNEKRVDQIIELAKKLDTQVITFTPPHFSDKNTHWYKQHLAKVKHATHLSIAVQNVLPRNIFFIIPEYKNASLVEIKKITGDTALDIANIDITSGIDAIKAQKMLGATIKNVFLCDKNAGKTGLLPGGAGGGISYLPLESLLMKLKASSYTGFLTLRVDPRAMGVGNEDRVIQNLEYVKKYTDKHFYNFK